MIDAGATGIICGHCAAIDPMHDWSTDRWLTSLYLLENRDEETINFFMMKGEYGNQWTDSLFQEQENDNVYPEDE